MFNLPPTHSPMIFILEVSVPPPFPGPPGSFGLPQHGLLCASVWGGPSSQTQEAFSSLVWREEGVAMFLGM